MAETVKYIETLMQDLHKPEEAIMAQALQKGLKHLWRERILGQYLRGQITRGEAIEAAGIDWVELAERQHKAMLEDLTWAMEK